MVPAKVVVVLSRPVTTVPAVPWRPFVRRWPSGGGRERTDGAGEAAGIEGGAGREDDLAAEDRAARAAAGREGEAAGVDVDGAGEVRILAADAEKAGAGLGDRRGGDVGVDRQADLVRDVLVGVDDDVAGRQRFRKPLIVGMVKVSALLVEVIVPLIVRAPASVKIVGPLPPLEPPSLLKVRLLIVWVLATGRCWTVAQVELGRAVHRHIRRARRAGWAG